MQLVKLGDTIIDVGAYTLVAAKIAGKDGKVIAFEPVPSNFSLLKKNVELNNYKNVLLKQNAVSNREKKMKIFLSNSNIGNHSIFNITGKREHIDVHAIQLDNYLMK